MQRLTIEALTPESAQNLFNALSAFFPELTEDENGRRFVSVDLGGDAHVVQVLNALQAFLDSRSDAAAASTVVVGLDGRSYMMRGA